MIVNFAARSVVGGVQRQSTKAMAQRLLVFGRSGDCCFGLTGWLRQSAPSPPGPLTIDDGWCDDPSHSDYNCQVTLAHPANCERLWRDDHIYDIIAVLGHNDDPVVPGAGSAIFLHLARQNYAPTQGCVALSEADLRAILDQVDQDSCLEVLG